MATFTKLPSGKWRAQVRKAGIYKNRTFDKKLDAQAWAAALEQSISRGSGVGLITPPKGMVFSDLVDAYLRSVRINNAAHAVLGAVCRVIGDTPVVSLNSYHLQRWIDARLSDGVAGSTIAHNLGLISGVLKWAKHTRHLDIDDMLAVNARRSLAAARISTTSAERDRYITDAEIEVMRSVFAAQKKLKIPMADLMDFALATAMRLGEIVRIEHADLSHNEGTIFIRDRKDPKRKIGNHQKVPLSSKAREIISRQPTSAGRIFPYPQNSVSSAWIAARDLAKLDDVTFHDLRHRAITDLFARGLAIQQVALISGHKTWAQLRRYTQVQPADLVELLG